MNSLNKKINLLSPFFLLKVSFYHSRMILFFKIKLKKTKRKGKKRTITLVVKQPKMKIIGRK
jgi:hypothetical protein